MSNYMNNDLYPQTSGEEQLPQEKSDKPEVWEYVLAAILMVAFIGLCFLGLGLVIAVPAFLGVLFAKR